MIVFCWQARSMMPDFEEGSLALPQRREMDRHLERCVACNSRVASNEALTGLLREAADLSNRAAHHLQGGGSPFSVDESLFEQRVMREIRLRRSEGTLRATMPGAPSFGAALPLSAAVVMLMAAVTIAIGLKGPAPRVPASVASSARNQAAIDHVAPAREIAFTVQQDLVGHRRGSIPETTYVLEPAPWEGPPSNGDRVIRASF